MTLLPMENRENILCSLKCFEKEKPNCIPPVLEDYIRQIARNGQTMIPWIYIKPLLLHKFNKVVDGFMGDNSASDFLTAPPVVTDLRQRVHDTLKRLDGIPFTIQRICELLENPFRHYSRPDKYLRGFEKVCMVVSTVDPQGNKMHLEDPRFPSRAGLDECNLDLNDPLISPPPSPSIYDLHRHRPSRSSDEEEATDDDENEDEEDVATEDSSHDSPNSPGAAASLRQPPVLTATTSSGAWLFGPKSAADTMVCKPQLQNLATEQGLTRSTATDSVSATDLAERVSPEDNEEKPTEINEQRSDLSTPPHNETGVAELSERPGLSSPPVCSEETPKPNRTLSPIETEPGSPDSNLPLQLGPGAGKDEWLTESPIRDLALCKPSGECLSPTTGEGVPPIVHILRPIGQLEAFVQNVGADISSSSPSSLPNALSSTSDSAVPFDSKMCVSDDTTLSEQAEERIVLPELDEKGKLTPGVKRRASSPDSSEQFSEGPLAGTSSEVTEEDFQQSPAKRRRLTATTPTTPEDDGTNLSGTPSIALNGSPPIIICSSVVPSRDRDSGEQTRSCFPSSFTTAGTESGDVGHDTNSVEQTERTHLSSPTGEPVSQHTHHINSETGEEEA